MYYSIFFSIIALCSVTLLHTSTEPQKEYPPKNPNTPLKRYRSWNDVKPKSPGNSNHRRKCSNGDKPRKDDELRQGAQEQQSLAEIRALYLLEKKKKKNQK